MKFTLLILISLLVLNGCNRKNHEKEITKERIRLEQKEQELSMRENLLNSRERNLLDRELKFDSSYRDVLADSIRTLAGTWLTKMTCIETTCSGSAIGDTKSEHWAFSFQGNTIIAKAVASENLVRVYIGSYNNNTLELVEDRPGTTLQPASKSTVRLRLLNENSMEGEREILRNNECKVIFSIRLDKQS